MSWDRARQRHGDTSQIFLFFFCQVSFKEKNLAHTKVERRLWRMESISLPPPHDAGGKKKPHLLPVPPLLTLYFVNFC